MSIEKVPLAAWLAALRGEPRDGPWSVPGTSDVLAIDLDAYEGDEPLPALHTGWPIVVVGVTARDEPERHPAAAVCDLAVPIGDPVLDAVAATVAEHPVASAAFASLLRGSPQRSIDDGLLAESAVYSTLQAGPEFAAWLAGRTRHARQSTGPPVDVRREGDELHLTLRRPEVRNALDREMRDALLDALVLARADPSISRIHLRGEGPSFCAGGDLDEFGSFGDPATAHLVRLQQNVGRSLAAVAERVTAHLHGACVGSGIELPAFATDVVADPTTVMSLPEVSLGLVPGAGGTVSLPRRIGRHRTARLGLTGERIDAPTALAWGLVDRVEPA